jgi:hypothetical protein
MLGSHWADDQPAAVPGPRKGRVRTHSSAGAIEPAAVTAVAGRPGRIAASGTLERTL